MNRGQSRKRERAISALLTAKTLSEAAHEAGIGHRTLQRWLKDDAFLRDYRKRQTELLESAVNSLRTAAREFVSTLVSVASDVEAPAGSRAAAASRGLEILLKAAAIEDLERRISELEASVEDERKTR